MRILFGGNQERGLACIRAIVGAGHEVVGVVAHPAGSARGGVAEEGRKLGVAVLQPADVNGPDIAETLDRLSPDVFVLVGYGQILRRPLIGRFQYGCINLHGGRLPQYRGSSPMNWALINGETEIVISAIVVDAGVDTGDVLGERTFPVTIDDTIADVQTRANALFPELLLDVLGRLEAGTADPRPQDESKASYWPLRFPDDGLVVWDHHSALQVHNRIRALTTPYPGAFTFWRGRRVTLLRSKLEERRVMGEPGRIYAVGLDGVLVCAADRCLRITDAVLEDGSPLEAAVCRYDMLATVRGLLVRGREQ